MLFDNNDMNFFSLMNIDTSDDLNLYGTKEGFLKGNMFPLLYMPYKDLTYINIKPRSDREAKLFNVMQYSFAINDLNLYLDIHPNDTYALNKLKEMIKEERVAKEEYTTKYGPLDIEEVSSDKFDWINEPWPWDDEGGSMYV